MFLKQIYEKKLSQEVERISSRLLQISCEDSEIDELYKYAVTAGRRSRPLLVLLGCEAVGGDREMAIPAAIAIELVHKASLVHDDMADEDEWRRGRRTFHERFGKPQAVIVGDLLLSLALDALQALSETYPDLVVLRCHRILADVLRNMCIGELRDLIYEQDLTITVDQCLDMTYQKTASLIEGALMMGAVLGGGTEEEQNALGTYGTKIGLAFQLQNDINNFTGLEQSLGRNKAGDVLQRKKTPLLCHTLSVASEEDRRHLVRLLNPGSLSKDQLEWIASLISTCDSLTYVRNLQKTLLDEARDCVSKLRKTRVRSLLSTVASETPNEWYWLARDSEDDSARSYAGRSASAA